jgi:hypothetical protein
MKHAAVFVILGDGLWFVLEKILRLGANLPTWTWLVSNSTSPLLKCFFLSRSRMSNTNLSSKKKSNINLSNKV